jgi:DNA-binding transcriptional regulator YhcF (GntR family)
LKEELVLREDKSCFEPLELGELFKVKRTPEYEEFKHLVELAEQQENEFAEEMDSMMYTIDNLRNQGYSDEQIDEYIDKMYGGVDEH